MVNTKQTLAPITTRAARIKGMGVSMTRIRTVDITPIKQRVMRSPRQEATGGAILSVTEI